MNIPCVSLPVARRAALGLIALLSVGSGYSQSEGAASQAERDIEQSRAVGEADRKAVSGSGTGGVERPSSAGDASASSRENESARANDSASDAVDRSRARALPGASPGDEPPARAGEPGRAVTDLPPGVTDGGGSTVTGGASAGMSTGDAVLRREDGSLSGGRVLSAERDAETTSRMIGETSFAYRDRAVSMAEQELSRGGAQASQIERSAVNVSGTPRMRLNDALRRVNESRAEYAKAISRARSANETRWEDSRGEVVERYQAYTKALEDARAAAAEGGARLE